METTQTNLVESLLALIAAAAANNRGNAVLMVREAVKGLSTHNAAAAAILSGFAREMGLGE